MRVLQPKVNSSTCSRSETAPEAVGCGAGGGLDLNPGSVTCQLGSFFHEEDQNGVATMFQRQCSGTDTASI